MKNIKFRLRKAIILFWVAITSDEVDSRLVKRYISSFFYEDYDQSIMSYFTDVRVFEYKNRFVVEITTHRPGILIGKGGRTVDALKEFLNKMELPKRVEIDIQESKMWYKLY